MRVESSVVGERAGGAGGGASSRPTPKLLGTAGGRRVGTLQGYEGGSDRMAGEGTGAVLGGGGGSVVGQLGVKGVGKGGGGGGGGGPRGLSRRTGNLDASEQTEVGGGE